jgi:hypothetical protein
MSTLRIDISGGRRGYKPGDTISGRVTWQVDDAPQSAELRLFWYTSGKGTQDVENVDVVAFQTPQMNDDRTFSVTLPRLPFSFSGKLISLVWALELIVEPGTNVAREQFVMSASGREVVLGESARESISV